MGTSWTLGKMVLEVLKDAGAGLGITPVKRSGVIWRVDSQEKYGARRKNRDGRIFGRA